MIKTKILAIFATIIGVISAISIIFLVLNLTGNAPVLKNEITVTSLSYTKDYDGKGALADGFEITEGSLFSGDHLELEYVGAYTDVGTYTNYFDAKVLNKKGKDVTDNYEITPIYGVLTIAPIKVGLKIESESREYNGEALEASKYEIVEGAIAEGEELEVNLKGSQTEIGESEIQVYPHVYKGSGESRKDVTNNYTFTSNKGYLTVNLINFTITSSDLRTEYAGVDVTQPQYETIGTLAPGDKIDYKNTGKIKNVGIAQNTYTMKIVDAEGNDASYKYSITKNVGTIEVYKKLVRMYSAGDSKEYDGKALSKPLFTVLDSEAESEKLTYQFSKSITLVGKIENTFEYAIEDAYGADTSSNYEFDISYGTLEITPYDIHITTEDATREYNGNQLISETGVIENKTQLETKFPGYQYNFVKYASLKDVDEIENSVSLLITNSSGINVSKCFNVITEFGTLKVTKKHIVIQMGSKSVAYDGNEKSCDDYVMDTTLASGEYIKLEQLSKLTEPGTVVNTAVPVVYDTNGSRIYQGNYEFDVRPGILTVFKQDKYQVYLQPETKIESIKNTSLIMASSLEVKGFEVYKAKGYRIDSITISGMQSGVGCGTSTIDKTSIVIKDSADNDVTSLFEFTCLPGTMIIYDYIFEIETGSLNKTYDGTDLTCNTITVNGVDGTGFSHVSVIIDGVLYDVYYEFAGKQTEIGTSTNIAVVTHIYYDEAGIQKDLLETSQCYISYKYGALTVNPA